jgi:outer membrane protein TolC
VETFVRGARTQHPANQEAQADRAGAAARADQALGTALPGLTLSGLYTRNQREVSVGGLKVVPRDQLDGSVTLSVPLLDLAKFARISAAKRVAEAAGHRQAAAALETEAQVVQGYFQLAANLALGDAARKALDAARTNLELSDGALRAGTATTLDVQRASAEVERQSQQVTSAELAVKLAARALESQTAVTPDTGSGPALADDLHPEAPLASFAAASASTPVVRAATATRSAAERSATAERLGLLPTLNGSLSERYTNATGFQGGHHDVYTATVEAVWAFDFATAPGIRARDAEAAAARAREKGAQLAAGDAIHRAWSTIEASVARSRSARAQAAVSGRAADIARTRYRSGVATQLELIQADRDAFAAQAARIQSDAELLNARAQLRIASGADPFDRLGSSFAVKPISRDRRPRRGGGAGRRDLHRHGRRPRAPVLPDRNLPTGRRCPGRERGGRRACPIRCRRPPRRSRWEPPGARRQS